MENVFWQEHIKHMRNCTDVTIDLVYTRCNYSVFCSGYVELDENVVETLLQNLN